MSQVNVLFSTQFDSERKHVEISVRENPRGRYLQIEEQANGRVNRSIVPAAGFDSFMLALQEAGHHLQEVPVDV